MTVTLMKKTCELGVMTGHLPLGEEWRKGLRMEGTVEGSQSSVTDHCYISGIEEVFPIFYIILGPH